MAEADPYLDTVNQLRGGAGAGVGPMQEAADPYADVVNSLRTGQPWEPPEKTSALGAFATSAAAGAIPAVGVLGGAEAGAEVGGAIGTAVAPGIGTAVGGFAGALGGGWLGGWGAGKAQDAAVEALPNSWKDPLKERLAAGEAEHPNWSFAGGLFPYAVTMSPLGPLKGGTALQRVMSVPWWGRALGGALQGGLELGNEFTNGETPDWAKVGIATGFGVIWNRPNAIGERIARGVRAPFDMLRGGVSRETGAGAERANPKIVDVDAAGVAGTGNTEESNEGTLNRNEAAFQAAQQAKADDDSITGPLAEPPPIHEAVRQSQPEMLAAYDALTETRDELAKAGLPEQAAKLDEQIDAIAPRVANAYRAEGERGGAETVEPPKEEPLPGPPIEAQKQRIASDVERQMVAAGRPADEAQAAGELVAARFATRAALLRGATGTAEELYARDGAVINGPTGAPRVVAPEPKPDAENPLAVVPATEAPPPLPLEPAKAEAEVIRRGAAPEPDAQTAVDQMIKEQVAAKVERPAKTAIAGISGNKKGILNPLKSRVAAKALTIPPERQAAFDELWPGLDRAERAKLAKSSSPEAMKRDRARADDSGVTTALMDELAKGKTPQEAAEDLWRNDRFWEVYSKFEQSGDEEGFALFIENVARSMRVPLDEPEWFDRWREAWNAENQPQLALEKPQETPTLRAEEKPGELQPGHPSEPIREGTRGVPEGEQPVRAPVDAIRRPPEVPAIGGGEREPNGEPPARPAHESDAGNALLGEGGRVTSPPSVRAGANQARPDTPAAKGRIEAVDRIEERSRSNYRITDDDKIGEGSRGDKIKANIEAIKVLKAVEEENREATPEEKAKLVKYTGWGAFSETMFNPRKEEFKREKDALRSLLNDKEYESARASTPNAHYTSAAVVRGMWGALGHLGFDGGQAIEPSAGAGHFIGLIPDAAAPRTAWTAVELDDITGRIAKKLYGGAEVNVQGYETLKRPANYYDLAISNVPFGDYHISEKPYGSHPIHDFFFVKSLDKVRPGGVVAFITSRYTLDRVDPSTRRLLAKSADLVGAIRLPGGDKGAFAKNAGTEVTTDILFLRKKIEGEPAHEWPKWEGLKEVQTPEGPTNINEYFADRPQMMLGEMRLVRTQYRAAEPALIGDVEGIDRKIAEAAALHMQAGALTKHGSAATTPPIVAPESAETLAQKEGAFFESGGKFFRRELGVARDIPISKPNEDRFRKLIGLRDQVNALLRAQIDQTGDRDRTRAGLRKAYDAFVDKYGPINKETYTVTKRLNRAGENVVLTKRPNFGDFVTDPDAFKVAALEHYDAETEKATPAAIMTRDVISPPVPRKIDTPSDALAASLSDLGRVDLQHIGRMMNVATEREVIDRLGDLVFQNPSGRAWETADEYLSGNVVQKLEEARSLAATDEQWKRNVAALEKVQPKPLTPSDIVVQCGAPWVPPEVYGDFLQELGVRDVKVTFVPETAKFAFESKNKTWAGALQTEHGTGRVRAEKVIEAALNTGRISVYGGRSEDGTKVYVNEKGDNILNPGATEEANVKVQNIRDKFSGNDEIGLEAWWRDDPDRTESLTALYNRTFNNLVARKFDGSHLTLPGYGGPPLRQHQLDAAWRIVAKGNTLLGHVVGAGKTFTMIAGAMEEKRLGLISKPAFAVPNHMLEQFSREFLQAYPNAKLLIASEDEMSADNRRAFVAKAAANDWDAVIMKHTGFGAIGMSRDAKEAFVRDQIEELVRVQTAAAADEGKNGPNVKQLEKNKKKLNDKLTKLLNEEKKDEGTTFEETGIDRIYVDEAHLFKNLSFPTRFTRIKGIGRSEAQRSEDLYMKIRYLEQKRKDRSAVFATGTPISNTMGELWTMMRYLELDKLRERGLDTFDAWANTFGQIRRNMEISADGRSLQEVSSFSRFVNIPELISIYSEVADTKTADQLNLPRPKVRQLTGNGQPGITVVKAEPSAQEERQIQALVAEAQYMKDHPKAPAKGERNMLSIVTDGRKVATDGRLIDPNRFDLNPKGKIALAVKNISRLYKMADEHPTRKLQMVFLDMGTPKAGRAARPIGEEEEERPEDFGVTTDYDDPAQREPEKIDLYDDLRQRLVKAGIPKGEIAFMHEAANDAQKAKLFQRARAGEIRVLIGSTGKMGVGTNVQTLLFAMHHLDAPYKPAEVEQRDGRMVRQGNLNPDVDILRYITKRSFDSFMWQKLDAKATFIGQVLSGTKGSRTAEDIDNPLPEAAELKAAATGDPRIMEHAELSRQVRQLQGQRRTYEKTQSDARWRIKSAQSDLENWTTQLAGARADAAKVQDLSGEKFKVTVGGKEYAKREEAGKAILESVVKAAANRFFSERDFNVGSMSGFDMVLNVVNKYRNGEYQITATPKLVSADGNPYKSYDDFYINAETDPNGLIRRFQNILAGIRENPANLERRITEQNQELVRLRTVAQDNFPREQEFRDATKRLADMTEDLSKKPEKPAPAPEVEMAQRRVKQNRDLEQAKLGNIHIEEGVPHNVITLFEGAGPHTIIHELGHDFLEQMIRDSVHEAAPPQLKEDMQTLREELGMKEGQTTPTTRQHERFARWHEQYFRTGVAPSAALARVFHQFRNWLLSIYQTIKGLGKPIPDRVTKVFDRMYAEEPQATIIAGEHEAGPSFADIHEADAKEAPTGPAAVPIMDRAEAETTRHESELTPEVQQAHETAVQKIEAAEAAQPAGEGGERAGEAGPMVADRGGLGPNAGERGGGVEPGAELGGGGATRAESPATAGGRGGPVSGSTAGAKSLSGGTIPNPEPRNAFGADTRDVDKAGNINLDRISAPDDVKRVIRAAAEANDNFIGDRRRKITWAETVQLSEALGMTPDKVLRRTLGQAFNAEECWAARSLLVQSAYGVKAAMDKAADGSDADVLAYAQARERHKMIQAQVAGMTAEAGRALGIFRKVAGGAEENAMVSAIDKIIRENTGRDLFQMKREAKLGKALDTPEQVSAFMNDTRKPNFGDMALEYWINNLISGIATHVTYSIANQILALTRAGPETGVAAAVGAVRARFGREGERVRAGEVARRLETMFGRGAIAGGQATVAAFNSGSTLRLPGERGGVGTPLEVRGQALRHAPTLDPNTFGVVRGNEEGFITGNSLLNAAGIEGEPLWGFVHSNQGAMPDVKTPIGTFPLGTVVRLPSRTISALHSYFRVSNYLMEINALAYRRATEEHEAREGGYTDTQFAARVAELKAHPTEEMMQAALETATTSTLMGPPGAITQKLSALVNTPINIPGVGPIKVFRFIDPFVTISSNIMKEGLLKRTPIGLLSPSIIADLKGEHGNVAADMALSRMLCGTMLAVTSLSLAAQGYVNGSGPTDYKLRNVWREAGNLPHSVRIGDVWYAYNRLGPLGLLMGVAADMHDVAHSAADGDYMQAGAMLQHAFIQNILDESFLRGPADLIKAIDDPAHSGERWLQQMGTSFLPFSVGMAQLARGMDPYSRQARTFMDAVKMKTPGLSESLWPRVSIWGQPMPSFEALVHGGVTAIYEDQMNRDPVNLALLRLGIGVAPVHSTIRGVQLDDGQYDDYARAAGRMLKSRLDVIVNSPMFQRSPGHVQADLIRVAVSQSREVARGWIMMRYPDIIAKSYQQKQDIYNKEDQE